jgi:hypothetical protein
MIMFLYCPRCGERLEEIPRCYTEFTDKFSCECGFTQCFLAFSHTPVKPLDKVEVCGSEIKIDFSKLNEV